jgi:hypothetical protein
MRLPPMASVVACVPASQPPALVLEEERRALALLLGAVLVRSLS